MCISSVVVYVAKLYQICYNSSHLERVQLITMTAYTGVSQLDGVDFLWVVYLISYKFVFHCVRKLICGMTACEKCNLHKSRETAFYLKYLYILILRDLMTRDLVTPLVKSKVKQKSFCLLQFVLTSRRESWVWLELESTELLYVCLFVRVTWKSQVISGWQSAELVV